MQMKKNAYKMIVNVLVVIIAMFSMAGLQQSVHAENVKGSLVINEELNDIDESTKQVKSTIEVTDDHNGASYVSSPSLADYFDYVDGKINVTSSTIKSVTLNVNGVEQTLNTNQYHFIDNKDYAGVQTSGLEIDGSVTSNIKMAKGDKIIMLVNIDSTKIENYNVEFRTHVGYYWNYINTIAVEGQKTWVDSNNIKGLRPKTITVNLLRNGTKIDSKLVDEVANWKYALTELPVSDKDNNPYTYTISEDAVANYITKIDGNNLTNTLVDDNDKTHDETDGDVVGGNTNNSSDLGTKNPDNHKSNNIENNKSTLLPKTAAHKLTVMGTISVGLLALIGLIVIKRRH